MVWISAHGSPVYSPPFSQMRISELFLSMSQDGQPYSSDNSSVGFSSVIFITMIVERIRTQQCIIFTRRR